METKPTQNKKTLRSGTLSIRVALRHVTKYSYGRPVALSPHVVRLRPAPHCRTRIESYSFRVRPDDHFINWQQDPFGNYQARLVFPKPVSSLEVEVDLIIEMAAQNPFDFFLEEYAERFSFAYPPELHRDLAPYLATAMVGPRFAELVERVRGEDARSGRRTVDVVTDINRRVQRVVRYDVRMEPGVFAPEETLARAQGSCRDFAWLLVQVFRHLGLAARFASGYSIQLRADEKPLLGPAGVAEDACDLHAWAEVFLPGAGWVGFDATSGLLAAEGHIPLACTPDPETAAPVTGTFGWDKRDGKDKVDEEFSVAMSVTRLTETPRVTKPYAEETWREIVEVGRAVDEKLVALDTRLTMGGEPTFVAADDPAADEWNTAALGPTKRRYASALTHRLYAKFTPGGLLHEGQGKWYPGEPLPRWALSCYFRKDKVPIWTRPELFAREGNGASASDGALFIAQLAKRLGVGPELAMAAYEDAFYYLWRERRLPVNVDPFDAKLDDAGERERLARIFEQGLDQIVGYALPLRRASTKEGGCWQSARWYLRSERLYLHAGDSPMGYRLPLDRLPWALPGDRQAIIERDPFAPRGPLPPLAQDRWGGPEKAAPPTGARPQPGESERDVVRTALCVEPRDGVLHVFMPPLDDVEAYLLLCSAVEETAGMLGRPVRIEGYHPPSDPRLGRLQVTPDPGVIEVNIHPAASWDDLVSNTTTLYEEAKQVGLRAEKFMLDGRHTGSGGGNHVVLGSDLPGDSIFLRRPDALRSMVSYWLNHPSLSYIFSGLFVGPTSQSPRIDEGRHDALYELEIAFREAQRKTDAPSLPPWLCDRLFRNLLVDVTGNTHRTEFCIDKLYSPDGPSGRLGLVELRAFEMPPHARMNLVQQLLVRSLLAVLLETPYREPLVRWATELHDRFALPHFVKTDFEDVLEHLARAGFMLAPAWFDPHFEFRFPLLGALEARGGIVVELRQAIEPWHVLGEEMGAAGTARHVDSSVERVEVKVQGMMEDRHVVVCNGRRVPLCPTGTRGEFVAGVRYRAWQPPSALHPTIGVHAPLVFDVVDRYNARSIAGFMYHVVHPGGRSYDVFPTNSIEAEARRRTRFSTFVHDPQSLVLPSEVDREFPMTLDLRK